MVLVDTNVLVDVLTADPIWCAWSTAQIRAHAREGLAINQIIAAELAPLFPSWTDELAVISHHGLTLLSMSWEASYPAGRAFVLYRRSGGTKTSPLPDFYIGAHAEAEGLKLLTRDATRYRTYFPSVTVISP